MHTQQSILDVIDAGLIVLDRGRRIVRWNAWIASASGYAAEDVGGKLLTEVFPHIDGSRLVAAIASALESGASSLLTHALHPLLLPLKTRAGRELLHDVTVSTFGGESESRCVIHISDVTMAVRRERYLRDQQNARYSAIVANAPDVILTLDAGGVIGHANPAAAMQFAYSANELIGRNVAILFGDQPAWSEMWQRVLAGEQASHPVELVAHRKDGTSCYLEVSASRWQTGSRVFVTAILRNIEERRAAESALRASEEEARAAANALEDLNATLEQRVQERTQQLLEVEAALRQSHKMEAIGQLTGGIAHDFNNLLQGITGALDMMRKRMAEGRIADMDRFLKGALTSVERASALTHRLLAFSRQQPVDPRPVDINHLIGTVEELLRRSIGEKIRMSIDGAADLWLTRCDTNQFENALLNLAINARDAMPEGGTLNIATSNRIFDAKQALVRDIPAGEYVCLEVSDTGVGMPQDVQVRAFDPFYTTKPIGKGTGLGLSMIYGFVRQASGSTRIQSEVGRGTTIELCLPRFTGDLDAVADKTAPPDESRIGNNEVVLVVEDEDMVRMLVIEVLNDLGYRGLEAADGPSALRILQSSQRIDLLVTDIGLPEMNGRQVADAGRTKRPNLKILFMTGYAESAASSDFLEQGMQIITKPFTMDKLSKKIRDIIEAGSP